MNKRERLHAAFHKQPVDRPPIALWRHFPKDDLDPEKFARRVVAFQNEYDFDLVKVTPAASYVAEMYGGVLEDAGNVEGTRRHVKRVIDRWEDWLDIQPLDRDHPVFVREREAMRRIRAGLGKDVPILQTIFSPLSCARTLAGEEFVQDVRGHPGALHRALNALGTTMERFALDSIEAGADGIFLATQVALRDLITPEESRGYGQAYNLALLNKLHGHVDFVLLHIHGENTYYEHLFKYPVQVVNWHDRRTAPTLREGKELFHGAVAGGLDETDTMPNGSPEDVAAQVRDAITQTGGTGLIIAAGCVIPITTPEANIRAARRAVDQS